MKLELIRADLHLHTALSACADVEMTPPAIVAAALARDLQMIAVCDHNSARNVAAVIEAADARLAVVAGIEVTTSEEVHVLGLFPTASAAAAASAQIRSLLPESDDDYTRVFGEQLLLAADGSERGREDKALAMATPLPLEAAVALIKRYNGLAVAAHVDRSTFGVIGQLGVFPEHAGFDAVELSRNAKPASPKVAAADATGLPVLHSSDAHYLEDVGAAASSLRVAAATFRELAMAIAASDGRQVAGA